MFGDKFEDDGVDSTNEKDKNIAQETEAKPVGVKPSTENETPLSATPEPVTVPDGRLLVDAPAASSDAKGGEDSAKVEEKKEGKAKEEELPEEEQQLKINRAAQVAVQRSTDDLRAMLRVIPPVGDGTPVNDELIRKALEEKKVTFGIDEEKIREVVEQQIYGQTVTVANGEQPVNGEDARVIFHYNKLIKRQDRSLDNLEQIDWKELGNIINTEPEVLLLEKVPPTEGTPGRTVTDKPIRQTRGKDLRIRSGKGVRADSDNLKWYSEIAGHVIFRNDQISVENIIELEDVSATTGNVHFNGTVVIKGIVEDGYSVDCTADLRIEGNVGAARLNAGGNITIIGGVFGKNKAVVNAGESIITRFTQDATIVAMKDIIIDEYSRNSDLKAGREIHMVNDNTNRGSIMGGSASALESIHCNNIGSEMELRTKVAVGVAKEDMDRIAELEANLKKRIQNLDNMRKSLFILQREKMNSRGKLIGRKQELHERFLEMLTKLRTVGHEELRELLDLYLNSYVQKKSYLHIHNQLFANVEVSIKNATMDVRRPIEYATLTESDGEITVMPLLDRKEDAQQSK